MTTSFRNFAAAVAALLLCAAPAAVIAAAGGEIFKRELPDGTVIFSDQPHPDATQVEPRGPQVIPSFQAPPPPPVRPAGPEEAFRYHRLAITAPGDNEAVWNHEGVIEVGVDVEPALQPGHRLIVLMDGAVVADAGSGGRFVIGGVFRGTHVLAAVVEDADGKPLIESAPVTFHLHQHSILSPTRPQR